MTHRTPADYTDAELAGSEAKPTRRSTGSILTPRAVLSACAAVIKEDRAAQAKVIAELMASIEKLEARNEQEAPARRLRAVGGE
jgi:hypothetical protein